MPSNSITLLLGGDVMAGRGIDQILPHPSDPRLHERHVTDARQYVALAERANGPVARPVDFAYPWGDAIADMQALGPDARFVNLETSITESDDWLAKGINYRMNPGNLACLAAFAIDGCTLANNHVMDWGGAGLLDTIAALRGAGIAMTGAGPDISAAEAPAILPVVGKGRVIVYGVAAASSGVPADWAADVGRLGVRLLPDLTPRQARRFAAGLWSDRQSGDIVVASVHWGGNWGHDIPTEHVELAHALIEDGGVDIVHGHSSHHPKAIEVHRGKLVLYGCGDFINDYEGIRGYEEFRGDLALAYLPTVDTATGRLIKLSMLPYVIRNLRLNRPPPGDIAWLAGALSKASAGFGVRIAPNADTGLNLVFR
ncbi:CapA family protein [Desertibaculum subflavum]|uniref:CapA family protein n=1 Tax=Desertibaculum subflavum TaxID=2268458 RepID=UPI000E66CD64